MGIISDTVKIEGGFHELVVEHIITSEDAEVPKAIPLGARLRVLSNTVESMMISVEMNRESSRLLSSRHCRHQQLATVCG